VKPGGWLILEELDISRIIESGGPVVSRVMAIWSAILQARGADVDIGRKMESMIQSTGSFSEIHSQKVSMPICNNGCDGQHIFY
jgi:Na+-translocating ferredoxin:NAD+ oxidoreductase RnfC subunit